ncbi:MAG: DUF2062 domain-containing protein [Pseudomonadota bacterium]
MARMAWARHEGMSVLVFKRREKRSWVRAFAEFLWPRGGWGRAAQYVQHRLRRLPDRPERIARGIWAGVFVSFTPLYGLHFVVSALMAKLMRGNIVAALLATFFGNPITFPIIAALSLRLGNWMLGGEFAATGEGRLGEKFANAFAELWHNTKAIFTADTAHWDGLIAFYRDVFLPYLVGGMIPGIVVATMFYVLALPVITAYQNRRRGRLQARLKKLRAAAPSVAAKAKSAARVKRTRPDGV